MTTPARRAHAPAWALAFLAAVLAVVLGMFTAGPASAATTPTAQNAVGPFKPTAQVAVEPSASITAGQQLGNDPPRPGIVVATGVAANEVDDLARLTVSEQRSVRSLQSQVETHQAKLDAYRANPDAYDNLGILERAPTPEIRQRIIDGRIRHLETEIRTFQDQIDKLLGGGQ